VEYQLPEGAVPLIGPGEPSVWQLVERKTGQRVPESYRSFLECYNGVDFRGAYPQIDDGDDALDGPKEILRMFGESDVVTEGRHGGGGLLRIIFLYGILGENSGLPERFLPIADVFPGCLILLSTSSSDVGRLYLSDEEPLVDPESDPPTPFHTRSWDCFEDFWAEVVRCTR